MSLGDIWGASDEPVRGDRSESIRKGMQYINAWVNDTTLPTDRIHTRLGLTYGEFDSIRYYRWEAFDTNGTMRALLVNTVKQAANCWCTAPMRSNRTPAQSVGLMEEGLALAELLAAEFEQ